MIPNDTDELIHTLARDLRPVRVLRPPLARAGGLLAIVFLVIGLAVWLKADLPSFAVRYAEPRMGLQSAATLLTGIGAVVAAFYLSVPGRSTSWSYLPLAPLALWILTSGLGCSKYGVGLGPEGDRLGLSAHCFVFIVAVSIPIMAFLALVLRRARPLDPLRVSLLAALGVAALAAFALQFFHPFDITWVDLGVHVAAMGSMIGVAVLCRAAIG